MKILITGAAGFIGSALMDRLAGTGDEVVGLDSLNSYYDVRMKFARLRRCGFAVPDGCRDEETGECREDVFPFGAELENAAGCRFIRLKIDDRSGMEELFRRERFDMVVNLAAQAGVRYSVSHPYSYLESNLTGFLVLLECCRCFGVRKLLFASSSSVYGMNPHVPYSETDMTDSPASLYAATKKSDELMAYAYSSLYGISVAGLRYFTVYGPWVRPDMAPMLFADAIMSGRQIKVFNNGDLMRDFTYIDDIVEGTVRVMGLLSSGGDEGKFRIYNIGASSPVRLMDFIRELEDALGRKAGMTFLPMQPGDVYGTYADVSRLAEETGYRPSVSLHDGIRRFAGWYMSEDNPLR